MITGEDLFAEEFGDEFENLEENDENDDGNAEGREDEAEEEKTEPKKVKPKRVVRNPQPKLNDQTLKGPKGLSALPSYFEKVKYKGKGYEEEDLNVVLKTYEYWCHRLFPKFPFDDAIAKIEKLGTKKSVQTYLKRIRMDLEDQDQPTPQDNDSDNSDDNTQENREDAFDQLVDTTPVEITEEQAERIRINRERAERLRLERLKRIQEQASQNLGESSQLSQDLFSSQQPSTSGTSQIVVDSNEKEIPASFDDELPEEIVSQVDSAIVESGKSVDNNEMAVDDILDQIDSKIEEDSNKNENSQKGTQEKSGNEDKEEERDEEMNIDDILDQINSDQT